MRYISKVIIGFEVKKSELFIEEKLGHKCPKGHENQDGPYCFKCGSKLIENNKYHPSPGLKRLLIHHNEWDRMTDEMIRNLHLEPLWDIIPSMYWIMGDEPCDDKMYLGCDISALSSRVETYEQFTNCAPITQARMQEAYLKAFEILQIYTGPNSKPIRDIGIIHYQHSEH